MAKNKNVGKPRNYALESGVYRFGKGSMYHKKAIYKFTKKVNKKAAPKKAAVFVEKQVGGAKNGGTRMVRAKKLANDVPTVDAAAPGTSKNFFANHVRKVRASLTAGTVAIVLAGVHKGKRVIVLKQLGTGLLLVTGPRQFQIGNRLVHAGLINHTKNVILTRKNIAARSRHVSLRSERLRCASEVGVWALTRVGVVHPLREEATVERDGSAVMQGDLLQALCQGGGQAAGSLHGR